jgi:hypothetical protein
MENPLMHPCCVDHAPVTLQTSKNVEQKSAADGNGSQIGVTPARLACEQCAVRNDAFACCLATVR